MQGLRAQARAVVLQNRLPVSQQQQRAQARLGIRQLGLQALELRLRNAVGLWWRQRPVCIRGQGGGRPMQGHGPAHGRGQGQAPAGLACPAMP